MDNDINHLIENRHIRVFISSTFQDMQDERDYLMKRTFPELRKIAAERDVTLTELDLRWGITEEESKNGKVIEICLREIENSIPFFIGIVGTRYGWCPEISDVSESVIERYEQITDYINNHYSITEMEMQFGVLERQENMNAFFYIKKNEKNSKEIDGAVKLGKLKNKILNNGRYPVFEYASKEELSQNVKDAFVSLLDKLFPKEELSFLEKERIGQRAFKNQLCQAYVPVESNFSLLDNWFSDWSEPCFVIIGESGIGKSAFIANWLNRKINDVDCTCEFIYYFVGNGGSEGNYEDIIHILCEEIKDKYKLFWASNSELTNESHSELYNLFLQVATKEKPLVIVLDAVNQLIDYENAKLLNWLPVPPKNIKILFSTIEGDETMTVFKRYHYPTLVIQPLNNNERRSVIEQYLGKYAKKLTEEQTSRIVKHPLCKNTLVLKTFLDELISFGYYKRINERIDYYLTNSSIEGFYEALLKNYEKEFGSKFIKDVFALIAVSRNGLSEKEISDILQLQALTWSQFYCSFMRNFHTNEGLISFSHQYLSKAVRKAYLSKKKDELYYRGVLYGWFNKNNSNRGLIEIPYQLSMAEDNDKLFTFLSDLLHFSYLFSNDNAALRYYWNQLINDASGKYSLDVYLNQSRDGIDGHMLGEIFNQIGFFINLGYSKSILSLKYYSIALQNKLKFEGLNSPSTAITYNNMGSVYLEIGKYNEAIEMYEKALLIRRNVFGEQSADVATTYNNIGTVYECIDCQKAIPYLQKALYIRQKLAECSTDVAISFNNISSAYLRLHLCKELSKDKLQQVKHYLEKAIQIQLKLVGEKNENTAIFYNNLGTVCGYLLEYKEAKSCFEKSLEINTSLFIENHPSIASNYLCLGEMYQELCDFTKSIYYTQRALNIRIAIYGHNDFRVADLYIMLGRSYIDLDKTDMALSYFSEGLKIYERKDDSVMVKSSISDIYNDIGFCFYKQNNNEQAIVYYEKAIELQKELMSQNTFNEGFYAILINNIARAYFMKGDYSLSYSYQREALEMQIKLYGENNINTARSFNNIGLIFTEQGEFDKALALLKKGLEIRVSLIGDNRLDVADSYTNIGDLYYKMQKYDEALEQFGKAYEIYECIFDKNSNKCEALSLKMKKARQKRYWSKLF